MTALLQVILIIFKNFSIYLVFWANNDGTMPDSLQKKLN